MKKYAFLLLLATACNSGETITKTEIEEPASTVIEYTPAPGQFINSAMAGFDTQAITTAADAVAYAERRLAMGGDPDPDSPTADYGFVSLGGWGGYLVVGFDTPVASTGGYDLYVTGNSFNGSSEPGIVWVAQDANGDGSPAGETWYELKGSEYGNGKTIFNYEVTYTEQADGSIAWTDNQTPAGSGTIDRIGAHAQASYAPAWVKTLTYTGTRLPDNVRYDEATNRYVMTAFAWGYADNSSKIDGIGAKNRFKISDAVDKDGHPANLTQIDFMKVQTGVNCKAENNVGEISTEVCGIGCYRIVTKTE